MYEGRRRNEKKREKDEEGKPKEGGREGGRSEWEGMLIQASDTAGPPAFTQPAPPAPPSSS